MSEKRKTAMLQCCTAHGEKDQRIEKVAVRFKRPTIHCSPYVCLNEVFASLPTDSCTGVVEAVVDHRRQRALEPV